MDVGISLPLPQDQFGADPGAIRAIAQAAEDLGYDHISVFDHVVGVDPASIQRPAVRYTHESIFHEPLTTLAWIAGFTSRIRLATGVLIAPQRQTALLAKQAAEVDVLSSGRLSRLGVGVGANPYEYEALGVPFSSRGARLDEQLDVLRMLWTQESVTVESAGSRLTASGISPRPVQRPIPIWVGGASDRAIRRAATSDGYILLTSDSDPSATIDRVHQALLEGGRARTGFGIQGWLDAASGSSTEWINRYQSARDDGITSLTVLTGSPDIGSPAEGRPEDHVRRFQDVAKCLGLKDES